MLPIAGVNLGFRSGNLHNLLKFQGLYASHSRGAEFSAVSRHATLLPQIIKSHMLLQHFLGVGDILRNVAQQQVE